jgi:hypothetical protein
MSPGDAEHAVDPASRGSPGHWRASVLEMVSADSVTTDSRDKRAEYGEAVSG